MAKARILIADDHEAMLKRTEDLLRSEFDVIATARDGESAVRLAVAENPDIVVLDISMPGQGGFAAAQAVVGADLAAKIVFLTVHEDQDMVDEALALGALGYVTKPRINTDLINAVHQALAGRTFVSPLR